MYIVKSKEKVKDTSLMKYSSKSFKKVQAQKQMVIKFMSKDTLQRRTR